jgi:hypothetical protein
MRDPQMKDLTIRNKLILSLVSIFLTFFGFWGLSLLAAAVASRPLGDAFSHKVLILLATALLQFCIILSQPIRRKFCLWLRLCAVTGTIILYSAAFMVELKKFNLIDSATGHLWIILTVLFALGVSAYLLPILSKHIPV